VARKTAPPAQPSSENPDAGLDQALTEVTTSTTRSLSRYRYPIMAIVAAISVIALSYTAITAWRESSIVSANERLWEALDSPAAYKNQPTLETLQSILVDARGSAFDRYTVKRIGEYLLTLTDVTEEETEQQKGPISPEVAEKQALVLAEDALQRFADDGAMKKWADGVKKEFSDPAVLPPSPTFELPSSSSEQPVSSEGE